MESQYGQVQDSLKGLTRDVAATQFTAPGIDLAWNQYTPATASAAPINVNVYALEPSLEVGRRVADALQRYQAVGGSR